MTTSTVAPEIVAFAAAVRQALVDLPAEDVDDLTEGLEADLAESLAEDLRRTLPDPVAYAAELRLAAGLPAAGRKPGALAGLVDGLHTTRRDLTESIRRNPSLSTVLDFAISLRPAWWIVRAWVATWLAEAMFGRDSGFLPYDAWWFVLAGAIVVSVQWGRGRWQFPGIVPIVMVGNVVAAVALLPVVAAADSPDRGYYDYADAAVDEGSPGVSLDGTPVTNIYAYDAAGAPMLNVQLFDQDGRPLDPFGAQAGDGQPCGDDECMTLVNPSLLETGQTAYNVFPLNVVKAVWDDVSGATVPAPGATAAPPTSPFVKVPAVQVPTAQVPAEKLAEKSTEKSEKVAKPNE